MKNGKTNFVLSLDLIKHLDAVRGSYIVADLIISHITELYADYHFFDISGDGSIIGHRGKHVNKLTVGKWAAGLLKENQICKMREVNLFTHYDVRDSDIEAFANHLKGRAVLHSYSFEVVDAGYIPEVVTMKREDTSRLGDSCMNNHPDHFRMLTHCKDVQCIIVKSITGVLIARSFLWTVDVGGGKVKFMDRFYTCRDYLDGALMDYARDNGYWRKHKYDSYEKPQKWVSPEMQIVNVVGTIAMEHQKYPSYPYLDTFCFGGNGFLSNSSKGAIYMYQSVFGTRVVQRQYSYDKLEEREQIIRAVNVITPNSVSI